jgi:hypothetical protein
MKLLHSKHALPILGEGAMRAFIIRPFGKKLGIDFDRVESALIGPALTKFNITGRTTGEILEAGNIRTDMFQQLLVADLVIADISTNNANAFYELGIRHALRDRRTFLLRSRTREPKPGATSARASKKRAQEQEVPFDLRTDRYLAYDPNNPARSLPALIDGLRQTLAGDRQDSPVFLSLPALQVQDRSRFTPVPQDFGEEVARAVEARQPERLALLGLEVQGFTWETEGLRVVGRAQFKAKYLRDARISWEGVRKIDANDCEANLMLGTIYQRLDDLTESNIALERVIALKTATPANLAEAYALMGRNQKQLWLKEWSDAAPAERRQHAFSSPLLLDACRQYRKAFQQDLNAYYPGINALALLVAFFELVRIFPDAWKARFADARKSESELADLELELNELKATVHSCIQANKLRCADSDPWLNITEADWCLLTSDRPAAVSFAYGSVAVKLEEFMKDSIRRQLDIYNSLEILPANVKAAFEALGHTPPEGPAPAKERLDHVMLFTGHRIDAANRPQPRFPAACESAARTAIQKAVERVRAIAPGKILGIAGAASGGDILFHEVCHDLGIPTRICLALPADPYIAESVKPSNADWVERFYKLGAGGRDVPVLAATPELPRWLSTKKDYDIWQRNNMWELCCALTQDADHMTLIALWDGRKGDGPGGTEHMVGIARARGANVDILDTRQTFGLQQTNASGAKPRTAPSPQKKAKGRGDRGSRRY